LKQEKNMLQAFAENFRRCVRAFVLPVVVLAVIFAATGCDEDAAVVNSQLIEAAKSGDTAEVERPLAGGADVNYQGVNGVNALITASLQGHGAIVDALLAKGAAIDVQAKDGRTALIMASGKGHGAIVDALLAKGAAVNVQVKGGPTALFMASQNG
jgi:serine/threonine-protein phosphatase 6 regulatory ankyrin repeat subunit B